MPPCSLRAPSYSFGSCLRSSCGQGTERGGLGPVLHVDCLGVPRCRGLATPVWPLL